MTPNKYDFKLCISIYLYFNNISFVKNGLTDIVIKICLLLYLLFRLQYMSNDPRPETALEPCDNANLPDVGHMWKNKGRIIIIITILLAVLVGIVSVVSNVLTVQQLKGLL